MERPTTDPFPPAGPAVTALLEEPDGGAGAAALPFEHMFNASPLAGSLARKRDGLLIAVNDAWVELLGLSREQAVGRRTTELDFWVNLEDRDRYLGNLPNTQDHQMLRLRGGQVHRVRLHTSAMDIDGEPCLLVFIGEATREYEAEQALERAHLALLQRVELLEASEKLAGMGHWTNDRESLALNWSAGLYAITGLEPKADFTRSEGRGRIHPDDMPAWLAAREAQDQRETVFRWVHPDGKVRWMRTWIGQTVVAGASQSDFGVVQDITAEHHAAERLSQQLAFIRNITAHVPGVLYQARMRPDRTSEIAYVNDAVRDLMEIEPADILRDATKIYSRVHAQDLPQLMGLLKYATRTLTTLRHVARTDLPVKGVRWCSVMAVPRKEADGSILWHGFITDVTASVLASQALERQHRMLEAVRRSQAEFIDAPDKRQAFEGLLAAFLNVTSSEYGFVGEVLKDGDDQPYLKAHAITNIAWDDASRQQFAEHHRDGMEFRNLKTLFGAVLTTGETVIANDPVNDPRSGGHPVGHRPMRAFLGIPIHIGDHMVAMVGLANRAEGYSEEDVAFLEPLLGTVRQLVVALRSAKERQQTRLELEATSRLLAVKSQALERTLESISQGLTQVDAQGCVTLFNQRLLELLDLPASLLASSPRMDAVIQLQRERGDFGSQLERVEAHARGFIQGDPNAPVPDRYLRRTQDGRTLEVRSRPMHDGGMVRTYTDVSPYMEAQEALRAERQRLEWVLEATRPGIWESDLVTGKMTINGRWAEMLGYTVAELEPVSVETWKRLIHPDDLAKVLQLNQAHMEGQTPFFDCDVRMQHKAGHWVWVNDRGQVHQRDENGRALYMSGTHLDVTARVTAQEEARALNAGLELRVAQRTADLELTLKDMEAVSYSIAHDLRAPLRAVNGFAAVIAEDQGEALSASGRDMFDRIVRASRHMGQMLTDMLAMLQVVRVELDAVPVDMNAIARSTSEALMENGSRAHIEIQELPPVSGDAALLRQVMLNLVDNALKYSREQEKPTVLIGHDPQQQAYFVRDNGMGFDMAHAGKLFGLFQRLHVGSKVPGMGVGLAIVSRIIERHGGRVWAESKPGQGATFWWTLPSGN